jgi:hypothetical protein
VYLSAGEVVFVFEGDEVELIVNEIVNEPFGAVAEALGTWRELVEDPPRIARPVYSWGSDTAVAVEAWQHQSRSLPKRSASLAAR